MEFMDKLRNIGGNVTKIWKGGTRVLSGDWTGFRSVGEGVHGLFGDKDAMGKHLTGYGQTYKPDMNLLQYRESLKNK